MKSKIQFILPYLKNKFVLTVLFFLIWMLFFDRNDLVTQYKLKRQLSKLKDEKAFYQEKIKEMEQTNKELFTDAESLEKFAREKYLMKKDNEDIFLIVREKK